MNVVCFGFEVSLQELHHINNPTNKRNDMLHANIKQQKGFSSKI